MLHFIPERALDTLRRCLHPWARQRARKPVVSSFGATTAASSVAAKIACNHHLRKRSKQGGNRAGNLVTLWWVDGVYTNLRAEEDPRICLLVIIGVTADGKKELVSVSPSS